MSSQYRAMLASSSIDEGMVSFGNDVRGLIEAGPCGNSIPGAQGLSAGMAGRVAFKGLYQRKSFQQVSPSSKLWKKPLPAEQYIQDE